MQASTEFTGERISETVRQEVTPPLTGQPLSGGIHLLYLGSFERGWGME